MNKRDFIALTGENPEDMFGGDWENEVNSLLEVEKINPCDLCDIEVENLDDSLCPKCTIEFNKKIKNLV